MKSSDRHFYYGGDHVSFSFLAQDRGVRFRKKTTRCAKSAVAAAALLAAPPRPRTHAHTAATQSSLTSLCSSSCSIFHHALL